MKKCIMTNMAKLISIFIITIIIHTDCVSNKHINNYMAKDTSKCKKYERAFLQGDTELYYEVCEYCKGNRLVYALFAANNPTNPSPQACLDIYQIITGDYERNEVAIDSLSMELALKYLFRAVDLKYPLAIFLMAHLYAEGKYLPMDTVKSVEIIRTLHKEHKDRDRIVNFYERKFRDMWRKKESVNVSPSN